MDEHRYYAEILALGAGRHAAVERLRQLEVRRVHLSHTIEEWEPYRRTLSYQVPVGAYGVIQLENGSRLAYTTTSGKAEVATLQRWSGRPVKLFKAATVEELEEMLADDLAGVFTKAKADRRTRAITARGWDAVAERQKRIQIGRFWEVAVGRRRLQQAEAFDWLIWWQEMLGIDIRRRFRGTPVPEDVWEAIPEDLRTLHGVLRVEPETFWAEGFQTLDSQPDEPGVGVPNQLIVKQDQEADQEAESQSAG